MLSGPGSQREESHQFLPGADLQVHIRALSVPWHMVLKLQSEERRTCDSQMGAPARRCLNGEEEDANRVQGLQNPSWPPGSVWGPLLFQLLWQPPGPASRAGVTAVPCPLVGCHSSLKLCCLSVSSSSWVTRPAPANRNRTEGCVSLPLPTQRSSPLQH